MQKTAKSSELQFSIKLQKPDFEPILAPFWSPKKVRFPKKMI